jgi:hypothetical protein
MFHYSCINYNLKTSLSLVLDEFSKHKVNFLFSFSSVHTWPSKILRLEQHYIGRCKKNTFLRTIVKMNGSADLNETNTGFVGCN